MAAPVLSESNICRLCSNSIEWGNGISLYESVNSEPSLDSIINRYLPLKVVDDGKFPRQICQTCNLKIKDITSYFDVLTTGQKRLNELWKEQAERVRKEKRLEQSDNTNHIESEDVELNLITGIPTGDNGVRLFGEDHSATLALEGRNAPRKRPGRPRKPKPLEIAVDVFLEEVSINNQENPAELQPPSSTQQPLNPDEDPEQALAQMFKEADEIRLGTKEKSTRAGRRRRVPQRFSGVVQGKELDTILKNEGVIGPEEEEESAEDELDEEQEEEEEEEDLENEENESDTIPEEDENSSSTNNKVKKVTTRKVGRPKKKKHVCQCCFKSFIHPGSLSHHVRTHHLRTQFVCVDCNEKYATKEELEAHQQETTHSGERIEENPQYVDLDEPTEEGQEFKCLSCKEVFPLQSVLTKHIVEKHITEKSSICDLCGKIFSHASSVSYHKDVAHNKIAHKCDICGKGFRHKQLLQRHSLVHTEDRPFICHICGATFKTRANLFNHNMIHTEDKPYECTQCDSKFTHKTSLVLHLRWHKGEKPFQCNVCNKFFSQQGNLQEHMRIHTGEKPFGCELCSKRFTTSSQHKLHMKRHTGERPWKCEYCGKDFLHKDSWKTHLRRHKGEKPFSCPICSRTFAEQWALKKHVRLHTGEKPYSCNVCNKSFADLSNLQKHKKTHNKNVSLPPVTETSQAEEAVGNDANLSFMDGQHIIYVTEDQTQVLISTIQPEQAGLNDAETIESMMLMDDNNSEIPADIASVLAGGDDQSVGASGGSSNNDEILTIIGVADDGRPDNSGQQAVEFTTQDGNRVRLFIPADVDPYQFTADYLASLSEQ